MKRLSVQDAAFLQLETDECPTHTSGVSIYKLPKKYWGGKDHVFVNDLLAEYSKHSEFQPPLNQKLAGDFLTRNIAPSWIDDDSFDLDYHVRTNALPAPGSMEQLVELCERLHSYPLKRDRPLWELHIIQGLENDRLALFLKIHHACADGVSQMRLFLQSLALDANDLDRPPVWTMNGWGEPLATSDRSGFFRRFRSFAEETIKDVQSATTVTSDLISDALKFAMGTNPTPSPFLAPQVLFNHEINGYRRLGIASFEIKEFKSVAKKLGATLNDLVLAVIGGALREYLAEKEELPERSLTAMCPVSLHTPEDTEAKNKVSVFLTTLATNADHPMERLDLIKESAITGKDRVGEMSQNVAQYYSLVFGMPIMVAQTIGAKDNTPLAANLIVSNVPGPRIPMYLFGAELEHMFPLSVLQHGQGLNVTILSSAKYLDFGFLTAANLIDKPQELADLLKAQFEIYKAEAT